MTKSIVLSGVKTGKQLEELRMNLFKAQEGTQISYMVRSCFQKMMAKIVPIGKDKPHWTKIVEIEDKDYALPESWVEALPELVTAWERKHGKQIHIIRDKPAMEIKEIKGMKQNTLSIIENVVAYHVMGNNDLTPREVIQGMALLLKDPEGTITKKILDDLMGGKVTLSKEELLEAIK